MTKNLEIDFRTKSLLAALSILAESGKMSLLALIVVCGTMEKLRVMILMNMMKTSCSLYLLLIDAMHSYSSKYENMSTFGKLLDSLMLFHCPMALMNNETHFFSE